jgi:quercetin dioxygenase-like cupin family protein
MKEVDQRALAVTREDADAIQLPGRVWLHYTGPERSDARNATVGYSVFEAGAAPEGHVHENAEEVIYITAGRGQLVTPQGTFDLEPGTAVFIPIGLHHATVCDPGGTLEMVTCFSPAVVPGAYDPSRRPQGLPTSS